MIAWVKLLLYKPVIILSIRLLQSFIYLFILFVGKICEPTIFLWVGSSVFYKIFVTYSINNMKNFSKPRLFSKKTLTAFAPIAVIAVTGLVVYSINNTNTDTRRDAGSLQVNQKIDTLAELNSKELDAVATKALVVKQNEYVDKIEAQSKLEERILAGLPLDPNSQEVKDFNKAFEFDASKLSESDINSIKNKLQGVDEVENNQVEENVDIDGELNLNEKQKEILEQNLDREEEEKSESSSSRSFINKAKAQSGGANQLPSVGYKKLPTIEGFNVEKFTGVSNVSYPIDIPAIRGSIPYSVALNYSSRRIDELRLNKLGRANMPNGWNQINGDDAWDQRAYDDKNWDQVVGLGWDFANLQKISVDPKNRNENLLQWNGKQYRIKYIESENRYYTIPDSDLKITRLQGGRWRLVDIAGTSYVFGSEWVDPGVNPGRPSDTSFNEYSPGCNSSWDPNLPGTTPDTYCWIEISAWNLAQITDIHGNSLVFDVKQTISQDNVNLYNYGTGSTAFRTVAVRIENVKYNWNESKGKFMSVISFIYGDYTFKSGGDSFKIQRLNKIESRNDDKIINTYELSYKDTYSNPLWTGTRNYLLLTSITRKGFGAQGQERPYTFCYDSVSSNAGTVICNNTDNSDVRATQLLDTEEKRRNYKPNNMYLVSADNGYGGKVDYYYEFVSKIPKICTNHKNKDSEIYARFCTDEVTDLRAFTNDPIYDGYTGSIVHNNETSFYRVSKIVANNDSAGTLNAHSKLKVTKYEYNGTPVAYAKDFSKEDHHGFKRLNFEGLQFYGYPTVRTKVYEPNSATDLDGIKTFLTHTEEKTNLFVTRGASTNAHGDPNAQTTTCFMVDPRKGSIYESRVLNRDGNQTVGYTNTALALGIRYSPNFEWLTSEGHLSQKCNSKSENLPNFEVLTRETYSNIDGKESKSQTFYDYDFDLNINNSFGNSVKQKDFGVISDASDDIYSYTKYMSPLTNTTNWGDYRSKNLVSLPIISFKSAVNANPVAGTNPYISIDNIDPKQRYGISHMKYDERLNEWGYQTGVSGVKGLASKTSSVYYGSNFDNQNNRVELSSYTDYNKYGNPTRTNAPWTEGTTKGLQSATYYDDRYFMYPVCQLQARRKGISFDPNANWKTVCNSNSDRLATKYEYAQNPADEASWDDGLAKGLMYFTTDPNGARSRFEYDHYARVTKVFEPDPNVAGQIRSIASQEATYYDNLVPMRSRVKTRSTIVNAQGNVQDTYKTVDSIIDGFGNELESTMYSNWYDKEVNGVFTKVPYALYSRVDFNGVGQVTSKMDNVKLENRQMPTVPEKLPGGTVLTPAVRAEATITETKYDLLNRPYEVTVTVGQGTADALVTKEKIVYAGYITRTEDARGTTSEVEVDPRGLTKRTTTYICDSSKSVCNASVAGATAVNTRTEYHPVLLQPTAIFDTNNIQVQTRVYNTAGMVLRVGDRDRGPMFNYYDNASRLTKVVNSKGDSIESLYDEMNRVTTATMKNKAGAVRRVEEMVYDTNKLGQLYQRKLKDYTVSQTKYLQVVTTEYDFVGKVTKSTNKALDLTNPAVLAGTQEKYIEISKNPQYTVTGTVKETNTKIKNPNFNSGAEYVIDKTTYRYDDDGKLLKAIDKTTNTATDLIKDVRYTFNGQPYAITLGNNASERYQYDRMKRLANKTVKDSANAIIFDMNYGYETRNGLATGLINRTYSNTFVNEKSAFRYDSLGRLEGTVNDNAVNAEYNGMYSFDVVGNLLSKKEDSLVECQVCDMDRNGKIETSSQTSGDLGFMRNCLGKQVSDPICGKADLDGSGGVINSGDINMFLMQCTSRFANNSSCPVKEVDMDKATRSNVQNVFLTSHILANASNPEPNKCKLGEYATKVSYDANVNGCPYHGAMKSTFSDGKIVFYSYNHTGSTVKEFDQQGLWKEYKYDVLDMPVEYWERVNGTMKLISKYYYGLDGQRIAKLTY